MKKRTQDNFVRTALRLPPDLHKRVHEEAEISGRTFNAELIARIEAGLASQDEQATSIAYAKGVGDGVLHAFDALIARPVDDKAFADILDRLKHVSRTGRLPPLKRDEVFPVDLDNLPPPFSNRALEENLKAVDPKPRRPPKSK